MKQYNIERYVDAKQALCQDLHDLLDCVFATDTHDKNAVLPLSSLVQQLNLVNSRVYASLFSTMRREIMDALNRIESGDKSWMFHESINQTSLVQFVNQIFSRDDLYILTHTTPIVLLENNTHLRQPHQRQINKCLEILDNNIHNTPNLSQEHRESLLFLSKLVPLLSNCTSILHQALLKQFNCISGLPDFSYADQPLVTRSVHLLLQRQQTAIQLLPALSDHFLDQATIDSLDDNELRAQLLQTNLSQAMTALNEIILTPSDNPESPYQLCEQFKLTIARLHKTSLRLPNSFNNVSEKFTILRNALNHNNDNYYQPFFDLLASPTCSLLSMSEGNSLFQDADTNSLFNALLHPNCPLLSVSLNQEHQHLLGTERLLQLDEHYQKKRQDIGLALFHLAYYCVSYGVPRDITELIVAQSAPRHLPPTNLYANAHTLFAHKSHTNISMQPLTRHELEEENESSQEVKPSPITPPPV